MNQKALVVIGIAALWYVLAGGERVEGAPEPVTKRTKSVVEIDRESAKSQLRSLRAGQVLGVACETAEGFTSQQIDVFAKKAERLCNIRCSIGKLPKIVVKGGKAQHGVYCLNGGANLFAVPFLKAGSEPTFLVRRR